MGGWGESIALIRGINLPGKEQAQALGRELSGRAQTCMYEGSGLIHGTPLKQAQKNQ